MHGFLLALHSPEETISDYILSPSTIRSCSRLPRLLCWLCRPRLHWISHTALKQQLNSLPPLMSTIFPLQCTLHVATSCMNGGWSRERGVRDFCLSMLHRLCLPAKSNVLLQGHRTQNMLITQTMSCESSRWKI